MSEPTFAVIPSDFEEDEWAIGVLEMLLNMCADASGEKLREGWEADSDSMSYCLNGAREWLARQRVNLPLSETEP